MKKYFCIILVLVILSLSYAEDNKKISDLSLKEKIKKNINKSILPNSFYSSVSIGPFLYGNLGISYTKQGKKYTKEINFILHTGSYIESIAKEPYIYGLYFQTNYFKNPGKKGFYFNTDIGLDHYYISRSQSWFSGAETGEKKYFAKYSFWCWL